MGGQPIAALPEDQPKGAATYATSQAALDELKEGFDYWSGQVSTTSLQLCYALMAGNWLIFGSVQGILNSPWAKSSLFAVLLALLANLVSSYIFAEYTRGRFGYAEKDRERWETEFQEERKRPSEWPYSKGVEMVSIAMRAVKLFIPLVGGALLIIGAILK